MDRGATEKFINELKKNKEFCKQIVHHERIPSSPAIFSKLTPRLPPGLSDALKAKGLKGLYSHQTEAIQKARAGKNVLITTPTASGKTLTYNVPVLESILKDPQARAFYIFPMKALEQDQLKSLLGLISAMAGSKITAEVYDGDTSPALKNKIKTSPPNIIITNPDMFHLSFLPYHANWADFFRNLKFIILDELHIYRGVFGSHIAQVIRRINRVACHYGGKPQYIACSATIANPEEFARELTGIPFDLVKDNGAPDPGSHFLFINPDVSPYTSTVTLIKRLLARNLKVIAFTKSRKITELIHTWLIRQNYALAPFISSYRSGFLPEERREIEQKLSEGSIKAVISTSALEMGIDIGGLDVCILVGYPGTIINTWQRGGRAGRGSIPALIILMAQQDALDQYFMKNPDDFFKRDYETAVMDPFNVSILKAHLPCAASELPLTRSETFFNPQKILSVINDLLREGKLLQAEDENCYFSSMRRPHRFVDIRSVGEGYTILEKNTNKVIGKITGRKVFTECHKGAIYLHRASQYLIHSIDTETKNIHAANVKLSYFTRPKTEKETEILETIASKPVENFVVRKGRIRVTEHIVEYEKRNISSQQLLSVHCLDLPPIIYETVGFWIEIEKNIEISVSQMNLHFMGGIHAIEHAVISLFPLFALCDRNDIGGISIPFHPQINKGAIFIYDGYPGGVGLTERGFDTIKKLLSATLKLISECECDTGCPSCIHSPKCGSGNKPLDKMASVEILKILLGLKKIDSNFDMTEKKSITKKTGEKFKEKPSRKRICFFDLETQRSADEVGGWKNIHLMRMSVGVVYDSLDEKYYTYLEKDIQVLIEKLSTADLVVGFNIIKFDYTVLQPYTIVDLKKNNTFDMLTDIHQKLGYRLSLNHIANKTLKVEKSADGLQALKWFKEGKIEEIKHYCRKDVEITKDLFMFGVEKGYVLFQKKDIGVVRLSLDWSL